MDGRFEAERSVPVGNLGTVAAVLGLAFGSAAAVFVGVALVVWAVGWTVKLALAGGGLALLGVWVWVLSRVETMWFETESVRPVVTDEPAPAQRPVITVELAEADRRRLTFLDLPGAPDAMAELASGVLSGRPFAEGEWTGAHRPFSRADFRSIRATMLERGLLAWRRADAPAQGVELTLAGRAVFRRLAEARTHAHAETGARFLPDSATQ